MIDGAYVDTKQLLDLRFLSHTIGASQAPRGVQVGARLSKVRGRGIDFAEVRTYQPGDDVRNIDWRVTARKNKPHTKVFREERERPTLILIDQTQSMFFGSVVRLKSVAAAQVGALLAWRALSNGDRVGGVVVGNDNSKSFKPYRSAKRVARFISEIAAFNNALSRATGPDRTEFLPRQIEQLHRLATHNFRIYLISDFENFDTAMWKQPLNRLARHNEVVAIRTFDPLESQLPPAARYAVTDGVARWQFHSGNRQFREKYETLYAEQARTLEEDLRRSGVPCMALSTTDEPSGMNLI